MQLVDVMKVEIVISFSVVDIVYTGMLVMVLWIVGQPRSNIKMWHEARRQEKKIRGLMVDYKKRAERRRQYYERIVSNFITLWRTEW